MVQWLGRHASTAVGMGLIPGRGIKIPHETQGQTKKKKKLIWGAYLSSSHCLRNLLITCTSRNTVLNKTLLTKTTY